MRFIDEVVRKQAISVSKGDRGIGIEERVLAFVEASKPVDPILDDDRVVDWGLEARKCPDPIVVVAVGSINALPKRAVACVKGERLGPTLGYRLVCVIQIVVLSQGLASIDILRFKGEACNISQSI